MENGISPANFKSKTHKVFLVFNTATNYIRWAKINPKIDNLVICFLNGNWPNDYLWLVFVVNSILITLDHMLNAIHCFTDKFNEQLTQHDYLKPLHYLPNTKK